MDVETLKKRANEYNSRGWIKFVVMEGKEEKEKIKNFNLLIGEKLDLLEIILEEKIENEVAGRETLEFVNQISTLKNEFENLFKSYDDLLESINKKQKQL
jgi:hypothetical protein